VQIAAAHLHLGAAHFLIDPLGALYWPEQHLLVVADLHLEKGSAYATKRIFLPPYDTGATLATLATVITRHAPRYVIALGDSFHDGDGGNRLLAKDRATLAGLQNRREWIWIAGNHDPALPSDLGGERLHEATIAGITFRHAAEPRFDGHEVTGHFHPVARVAGSAGSVRRRCFVADSHRCILPALGAYAGGLNLHDAAFSPLFPQGERFAHVLGRDRVYRVAHHRCLPD
jgi:uncharacterized protein